MFSSVNRVFGDPNERQYSIQWAPEPQGRGTLSILWTCLVTMFLCVWTAVHLNLPKTEDASDSASRKLFRAFWRKARWLALGVFAPELVIHVATTQYLNARQRRASKHASDTDSVSEMGCIPTKQPHEKLSTTERFFVNMGGIAIDAREWPISYLPTHQRQHAPIYYFDLKAIKYIYEWDPKILVDLTPTAIDDKSKSNVMAKTLVCMQASWFMAQCITRIATSIPISILELNTFAHCVCALLIYILWWHKPMDVAHPIMLHGEKAHRLAAWLYQLGADDAEQRRPRLGPRDDMRFSNDTIHEVHNLPPDSASTRLLADTADYIVLEPGEEFFNTGFYNNTGEDLVMDKMEISRWRLAIPFAKSVHIVDDYTPLLYPQPYGDLPYGDLYDVRSHSSMNTSDLLTVLILVLAGFVYGGLHALAWNAPFRSPAEKALWRLSSVVIVAYGPVFSLVWIVFNYLLTPNDRITSDFYETWRFFGMLVTGRVNANTYQLNGAILPTVLLSIFNIMFLLARCYLVVESFVSLFQAVPGIFKTPDWSRYFPHAG